MNSAALFTGALAQSAPEGDTLRRPLSNQGAMTKTVMITGSSSGIGLATAHLFQQKGWNVAATMRNPDPQSPLAHLERVMCPQLDVLDPVSIQQAVALTLEQFGSIDVVVNNAGYAVAGPLEAATPEQIQKQMDTNVVGLMLMTQAVLPHFRERQEGILINMASMGGRLTFPLLSLYHATKWAVEGFSESLQFELQPFNIKVKVVEPGAINTDFYSRSLQAVAAPAYQTYIDKVLPVFRSAGEKGGSAEGVAQTVWQAATDESWTLRYPSQTKGLLMVRKLLPDQMFTGIIGKAFG